MTLQFRKLHPLFAAEASAVDLRAVHDEKTLERIRAGMDEHAVLVFRDQAFSSEEQRDFATRLDGELHRKTGISVLQKSRFGDEAITDVSNVDAGGEVLEADSRKRLYGLANRLWHTDASFQDPRGRYSMLAAVALPPVAADTEFADMRAATTRWRTRRRRSSKASARIIRSPIRASRSASTSRRRRATSSRGPSSRWCLRTRAPGGAPSILPRTRRGSSTGRSRMAGSSSAT